MNAVIYRREVIDIMIRSQLLLRFLREPSFHNPVTLVVYRHIWSIHVALVILAQMTTRYQRMYVKLGVHRKRLSPKTDEPFANYSLTPPKHHHCLLLHSL